MKAIETIQQAKEALQECLQSPPFIKSVNVEKELFACAVRVDLVIKVQFVDREKTIFAEIMNNGQPRFARQAVIQLCQYMQGSPGSYAIFVAPYISSDSANICKEAGIGYVDLGGNCFLNFDNVFINIQGKRNPFPQNRDLRTLFSPRASRIIRVLLNDPFIVWKIEELGNKAGVSLGLVADVKKILLDREWIKEKAVGFALVRPRELLQEWASQYNYRKNRILDFYSLKDESTIEQEINEFCSKKNIRFAFTLFSGASRIAPYTRFNRVFAYAEDGTEEIQNALGLKPVTTGPNITLLVPYDEGVFYGMINYSQMPVVSSIQLYLDLNSYKGRGEEAAQFLFEQVIEPSWLQKQTTEKEK